MPPRAYDNTLRAEQAERTKQRILEAAVELVAEAATVSTAAIAARAGVSEPTVYRHFPNREALIAGIDAWGQENLGPPPVPSKLEDIVPSAIAMGLYLGRNRTYIRAGMLNPELRELRMHGRRRRLADLRKTVAPRVAFLDERDRQLAFAAVATIMRAESWEYMTTEHGLSDEEAGRTMAFMLDACIDQLGRLAKQRETTITDEDSLAEARAMDARAVAGSRKKGRT